MSTVKETFLAGVADDLGIVATSIIQSAASVAQQKADDITRTTSGAVNPTPDQLAAMKDAIADDMFRELRERIESAATVYAISVTPQGD